MGKGIRTNLKIEGDKQLAVLLYELPRRAQKKALKQAVTAGATPIVKAVRRLVPTTSGLLKKSVTKKVKSYSGGNAIALIGANADLAGTYQGMNRIPKYYWHLVLGGTKPHSIKTASGSYQHPGSKAQNALQEGFDATKAQSQTKMEEKLKTVIEKEAAKLASK